MQTGQLIHVSKYKDSPIETPHRAMVIMLRTGPHVMGYHPNAWHVSPLDAVVYYEIPGPAMAHVHTHKHHLIYQVVQELDLGPSPVYVFERGWYWRNSPSLEHVILLLNSGAQPPPTGVGSHPLLSRVGG